MTKWILILGLAACPSQSALVRGDACTQVARAFCLRAAECDAPVPEECLREHVRACCGDACVDPSSVTDDDVSACAADLAEEACDALAAGIVPERCQMLPMVTNELRRVSPRATSQLRQRPDR
jgi:hypothetical protein